jgi:hypothetical protein
MGHSGGGEDMANHKNQKVDTHNSNCRHYQLAQLLHEVYFGQQNKVPPDDDQEGTDHHQTIRRGMGSAKILIVQSVFC